jgi:3-methyladenine DNA glycosylase AlkD
MVTIIQVLDELRTVGTEHNRKIYRRHGVGENQYGVSFANLKQMVKKIKVDHALAKQLWASGNHDARILATMIADPKQADMATLDAWVRDVDCYPLGDALSGYVAKTPLARQKMEEWTQSDDEWIGQVGWNLLAHLATNDKSLPDDYFQPFLDMVERDIHSSKNRVRHSKNLALISIGGRGAILEQAALAAAGRIGKVEVDHGETNCKTPDAVTYIEKMKAHRN